MDDILANSFTNFVGHEAFPLEKPLRANHVPMRFYIGSCVLGRCTAFFLILSIQLEVEDDLLLNLSSLLQCVNLIWYNFLRPVKQIIVCF